MKKKNKSVDQTVRDYVAFWKAANTSLSISGAVEAVRKQCPEAEHSDEELADLIARIAISSGCNLNFDFKKPRYR